LDKEKNQPGRRFIRPTTGPCERAIEKFLRLKRESQVKPPKPLDESSSNNEPALPQGGSDD